MYENIAVADINTAVNGIELSFASKPPYEVLKDLKENDFRWHNKKQIWYARNTAANVRAVEKYVDLNASDVSFGVTPEGIVDVRGMREKRLSQTDSLDEKISGSKDSYKFANYDLGFGSLGNGITVWNRLKEVRGDYQTVAHISPEREITFYDKQMPEDVVRQIRDFAEKENPTISATQSAPVFTTVGNASERADDRKPCIADFYDSVGGAGIYADSTVEGSLWSSLGSKGYYKDINAYVWCNSNSAIVIELDNAMKRGKECKRYSVYSNDVDSFSYITNELKINSPKELYDLVRSGKELPGNGQLNVTSEKGVEVFSPFVAVKPLEKLPEKWKKGDLVKAIMAGQVFSGVLDQRLTDDYAYDAAYNFGSGRKLDLPGQAADLVEGCRDCYIRTDGVDENGIASVHFSYAGDMKTFLFDVNCDLAESISRQELAKAELAAHNEKLRSSVKRVEPSEIDPSKIYVIDKLDEDFNSGKISIKQDCVQGFALADRLDIEELTAFCAAELVPNKLYEVANFFDRREYAEEDPRIINTGNWGQICSGKAIEELTREGVSLHLSMHSFKNPLTFEAAKKDCMEFISGKTFFMFGEKVDYSNSLKKLEAEEIRVARDKSLKKEPSSLLDVIGFAELKKEFEKNQRTSASYIKDRDTDRDDR